MRRLHWREDGFLFFTPPSTGIFITWAAELSWVTLKQSVSQSWHWDPLGIMTKFYLYLDNYGMMSYNILHVTCNSGVSYTWQHTTASKQHLPPCGKQIYTPVVLSKHRQKVVLSTMANPQMVLHLNIIWHDPMLQLLVSAYINQVTSTYKRNTNYTHVLAVCIFCTVNDLSTCSKRRVRWYLRWRQERV